VKRIIRTIAVVGLSAAWFTACSPTAEDTSRRPGAGNGGSAAGAAGNGAVAGSTGGTPPDLSVDGGGSGGSGAAPSEDGGPSPREPISIDQCGSDNPGGLSPADVQRLQTGGPSGAMRWLYPYDGTVFPRGLKAPLLMWDGAAADAVYVHIRSTLFEYKACLRPTAPGQLALDPSVWRTAEAQTLGAGDPFTIEITTLAGGAVTGPISEKVVIAQATLKGSIYYGSYNSRLAGGFGGGAVFRITPGQDAEFFLRQNTCTGCHSLSNNGARLLATETLTNGQSYRLAPGTPLQPAPARAALGTSFAGLSPAGSLYVSTAAMNGVGPRNGGPIQVPANATLYETDTGAVVANSGIPAGAMMPTFSPDGSLLVFNDYAIQNGRGLAVMRFDGAQRRASDYRQIHVDSQGYPGWPFALPDNRAVLFAAGVVPDFTGMGAGISPAVGPRSDLKLVDLASGTTILLARAMGFDSAASAAAERTYLPFGADDLHRHYYPTVSPVAAGGFFWVFFDTVRHYGNLGLERQLWGTALRIPPDGSYTADPSFPAFYLAGQELGTANHRAFTALDPCRQDGAGCESGIDCCSGFCTNGTCGPKKEPRCSQINESCQSSADCCDKAHSCIAGFCAIIIPG
jgi:hypothetical protein